MKCAIVSVLFALLPVAVAQRIYAAGIIYLNHVCHLCAYKIS